jgi:hypothetical protein
VVCAAGARVLSCGCRFDSCYRRLCCSSFLVGDSRLITCLTSFLMSIRSSKNNSDCIALAKIIPRYIYDNKILVEIHKAIGIFVSTCNPHNRMDCTRLFADQ